MKNQWIKRGKRIFPIMLLFIVLLAGTEADVYATGIQNQEEEASEEELTDEEKQAALLKEIYEMPVQTNELEG